MSDRRIIYQAKNLKTGLEGIYARVLSPSGEDFGTYFLQELTGEFSGIYFFVFPEVEHMAHGDYIGMIISPPEGHKAPFKVTITEKGALVGQTVVSLKEGDIKGFVSSMDLVGAVVDLNLLGAVKNGELLGSVEPSDLISEVKKDKLEWIIN